MPKKICKICGNVIGKRDRKLLEKWGYCREHLPERLSCPVTTKKGYICNNPKQTTHDVVCKFHKRFIPKGENKRKNISEFRAKYTLYLRSDEWKHKVLLCKNRFKYRCAICNSEDNLHVHHRTYDNVFDELLEDLTLLCGDCHKLFHQKTSKN